MSLDLRDCFKPFCHIIIYDIKSSSFIVLYFLFNFTVSLYMLIQLSILFLYNVLTMPSLPFSLDVLPSFSSYSGFLLSIIIPTSY